MRVAAPSAPPTALAPLIVEELVRRVSVVAIRALFVFSCLWISASFFPFPALTVPLFTGSAMIASTLFYQSEPAEVMLPPVFLDQPESRVNEGSNCAINAVVQALQFDPRFRESELLKMSSADLRRNVLQVERGQFDALQALDQILDQSIQNQEGRVLSLGLNDSFLDALALAIPRHERFQAPQAAWLHLKRFDERDKITRDYPVNFEISILNSTYQLQAFVVHVGSSVYGGHYVSYVKGERGRYYQCDDTRINRITQSEWDQQSRQSYLLLYVQ